MAVWVHVRLWQLTRFVKSEVEEVEVRAGHGNCSATKEAVGYPP